MSFSKIRESIIFGGILLITIALAGCTSRDDRTISEQYTYDGEGKLVSKIAPDGSKTTYKYNEQGLPIEVKYPGGWVRYAYDENGNRVWMKAKTGTTEYYYDAFDRVVGVIWKHSPWQLIVYDYDPWGYLAYMAIFNLRMIEQDPRYKDMLKEFEREISETGQRWRDRHLKFNQMMQRLSLENAQSKQRWLDYEVRYRHDILGNLTSIDTKEGSIKYLYYPDKGQIERRLPNGITTRFIYSAEGLLRSLRHESSIEQLIAEYRYDYNPAGKVINVYEATPEGLKTTGYTWDTRGYLKELDLPDGSKIQYDYDAMGNRILKEDATGTLRYDYDKFGRLTQAGNLRYEWDRNGNLLSQIEGEHKTRIKYDGRGLPSLIRLPDAIIHYDWDSDGNMISRRMGKDVTHYLPNPFAPSGFTLEEFDGTGRLKSSYFYGDVLLGQQDMSDQMRYFLEDGFNSIRHITDMTGKIVGQRDYTPFGEPIAIRGNMVGNFRMAGERFLPEIKSYAIGGRLYEPKLGRYLMPDQLPGYMGRFESFNKYAHACNISGMFAEPRGNQTRKVNNSVDLGRIVVRKSFDEDLRRQAEDYQETWWSDKWLREPKGPGMFPNIPVIRAPTSEESANWKEWDAIENALRGEKVKPVENKPRTGYDYGGLLPISPKSPLEKHPIGVILGPGAVPYKEVPRVLLEDSRLRSKSEIVNDPFTGKLKEFRVNNQIIWTDDKNNRRKYKDDQRKPFKGPDWPDGGGGPGGLGRGPFGGGFNDPFKSVENQLGGIELAASAQFVGNLGKITGAVYDPERQYLVLVGEKDTAVPSIKAEDLAVALALVFGPSPQDPQFSLDPADPLNPKGKWLKARYIPEQVIAGTTFGKALFEADWLLKEYSFGVKVDENGKLQERNSKVAGFKSTADLSLEEQGREYGKESWARSWIYVDDMDGDKKAKDGKTDYFEPVKMRVDARKQVPDPSCPTEPRDGVEKKHNMTMRLAKDGKTIYFEPVKMRVDARKQVPDPSCPTGLRDVETKDDPVAKKFAELFTELYDEIAKESPEFERVRELAKAVALAKWLKKEGVPVDMDWVIEYTNKRIETVARITALSVQWQKQNQKPYSKGGLTGIQTILHQLHLFGGVDLTVNPKYISDNGTARSLQGAVRSKLRQGDAGPLFTVEHNGKSLQAAVLPITRSGQEMWNRSPSIELNEIVYQFNNQGEVTKSIDKTGNTTEYAYDSNRKLKIVKISPSRGWKIIGERNGDGSVWTATNPRGNTLRYKYSNSGYLNAIEVDGHTWATYQYDPQGRPVVIRYNGYSEKIVYEASGSIREYEIQTEKGSPASAPQTERLIFEYNKIENLSKIAGNGVPWVSISYTEDGFRPIKITTPLAEIQYSYYSDGRVKEITHSSGISATYVYDGEYLTKLQVDYQGRQAEYWFNKDGPVQSRDLLGGIADYGYINGRLSSSKLAQYGEAKYAYDDQNRLREIRFPDGSWKEYRYESGKSRGRKSAGSQMQTLTVVTHPASERIKEQRRK